MATIRTCHRSYADGRLATDPDPVVHRAVGTFLEHAGARDPTALHRFLDVLAPSVPRAGLRLALAQLDPSYELAT